MKKVIVFSADGMVTEDLALLETLPNYQRYLAGGARIERMRSIYPTVTYPAHTTMSTGAYPDVHGVVSNYYFLPGQSPSVWQWTHEVVKCEDIFDAVKAAGHTTAASFWPCTGLHPSIDYLVAECWCRPGDTIPQIFRQTGSSEDMLNIVGRNQHLLSNGRDNKSPWADRFCVRCAADIIRQYQPDLLMLHPSILDSYRHESGLFTGLVTHGIHEIDQMIGELAEAAIDAGVWEDTNFFLVSDHGLQNICRSIKINVLLKEAGLLDTADGKLVDYRAYSTSNGMSALIYLKDPADKQLHDTVYALLRQWCDTGLYGIGAVFTREETAAKYGLDGDFSFVLETDGYSSFSDDCSLPICRELDHSDYRVGSATHGYLPELGPQPILVANGPDIRKGVTLQENHIVNEAPTYAAIFGLELKDAAGTPIYEILK